MSKQLYVEGDVIKDGKTELECVMVQWRDRDDERENFVYSFRLKSEMEKQREETTNPEGEEQ